MHALDQLMRCVVRIESHLHTGGTATGSGFAYQFQFADLGGLQVPVIVTNKHVIEDTRAISIPISRGDSDGNPTGQFEVVTYELSPQNVIAHPDDAVDLCAIFSAPILKHFENSGSKASLIHLEESVLADTALFDSLLPMEQVTMIGFPNGLWDSTNNGAIARNGIIATMPNHDYQGQKQFVVDMACFPGSSGSPVFLANFGTYAIRDGSVAMGTRIKLLGVLYAGPQHTADGQIVLQPIPTQNRPITLTSIPNNLGYVIKAMELRPLERLACKIVEIQKGSV